MENFFEWIDEDRSFIAKIILSKYNNVFLFYDRNWENWKNIFDFRKNEENQRFVMFDIGMESFELISSSKFFEDFSYEYSFRSFIMIGTKSILLWNFWDEISIYATNRQLEEKVILDIRDEYRVNANFILERYKSRWFYEVAEMYGFKMG